MTTAQTGESTLKNEVPEVLPSKQLKVLFSWKAPARVFKKRNREFWSTVLAIVFLLGVISFAIQEWFLLVVIISLVFVYYVLSTVPPEEVEHQITNRGIRSGGKAYGWEEFIQFWFSKHWDQKILNLENIARVPGRLELLLGSQEEEGIRKLLLKYLPEEEAELSFLDRAASWLSKKVPLEIN